MRRRTANTTNFCSKTIYIIVTVLAMLAALFFFSRYFSSFTFSDFFKLAILCLIILVIHVFKFCRLYFILLQQAMPLPTAIKLYTKTQFISILLPFKIGEIYRMYAYGYKINNYTRGVLAILVDKIFDAIIALIILLPAALNNDKASIVIVVALSIFLFMFFLFYAFFRTTYNYLNRFLITQKHGKRSIYALRALNACNTIHDELHGMLKGRILVCATLSIAAWIAEFLSIFVGCEITNSQFYATSISIYISDGYYGVDNASTRNYIIGCSIVFLVLILIIYAKQLISMFSKRRNK